MHGVWRFAHDTPEAAPRSLARLPSPASSPHDNDTQCPQLLDSFGDHQTSRKYGPWSATSRHYHVTGAIARSPTGTVSTGPIRLNKFCPDRTHFLFTGGHRATGLPGTFKDTPVLPGPSFAPPVTLWRPLQGLERRRVAPPPPRPGEGPGFGAPETLNFRLKPGTGDSPRTGGPQERTAPSGALQPRRNHAE